MSKQLMQADLKRSGISDTQAKSLGFKLLSPEQTVKRTGQDRANVPSYLIPYYDIKGKATDYWRLRYLEAPRGAFGAKLEDRRYTQPKATPPHLYFAKVVNWANPIASDPSEPVIITEGEKKAAAGCLAGFPTIGLGGVWSWKSKTFDMAMLPEFDQITWKGRKVYLCFDSDMNEKPQVAGALHALAKALVNRGAVLMLTRLEDDGDNKVGLDDFLASFKGAKPRRAAMMELLAGSEAFSLSEELYALNDEVAIVQGAYIYYFPQDKLYATKTQLKDIAYAGRTVDSFNAAGEPTQINAFDAWLKWPYRREHIDLTYKPGEPEVTDDNYANLWRGWGVEPERGNVKPFMELLDYVCEGDKAFRAWFIKWLAYPLQNPGAKMFSSVVLWSPDQGVGKSFIGALVGDIYGKNYLNLTPKVLHGSFNEWAARRQFILGDEIVSTDKRRGADELKQIITQEDVYINAKWQAPYELPDCINYLFTSNHPAAFFLEDKDRRYAIHRVAGAPQPQAFYDTVKQWRADNGPAHLFDWLLRHDVTGFNPSAPAISTESKEVMIEEGRTDLETWVTELLSAPQAMLQMDGHATKKELFTPSELLAFYDPEGRKGVQASTIGRALSKHGIKLRQVRFKDGAVRRLYAVANVEQWDKANIGLWAEHVEKLIKVRKY